MALFDKVKEGIDKATEQGKERINERKEQQAFKEEKKQVQKEEKLDKELEKQTKKNRKVLEKLEATDALYAIQANMVEKAILGNKARKVTMIFFNDRIEIVKKGLLSGNKGNISFYYDEIDHIDFLKSLIQKPTITIQIKSVKHEFYIKTSKDLAEKVAAEIRSKSREHRLKPTSAPQEEGKDKLQKLKELGELKEAGILSDEEFENEKQKILSE